MLRFTTRQPLLVILCRLPDDYDEFRFNDASTHEGHLRQNGVLTWFCYETAIMMSYMSPPREREKRDRAEREGQGRKRKMNESEETEEIKTLPLYHYLLQG